MFYFNIFIYLILTKLIRMLNEKLNILCKDNNFYYLSNDSITRNNLVEDGFHLNENKMHILANNFVDFVNNLIFEENNDFNNNKF